MPKKLIGKVLHQSMSSKNLIVKLMEQSSIGDYIFDNNEEKIGEIFDIIGPVDSPLATIKLDNKSIPFNTDQLVYTSERREKKSRKRSRRRR